jgi:hypothetical protein
MQFGRTRAAADDVVASDNETLLSASLMCRTTILSDRRSRTRAADDHPAAEEGNTTQAPIVDLQRRDLADFSARPAK